MTDRKFESNQKKIILINTKKKRVFYVKLVYFVQGRAYFRPFMHVVVAIITK